MRILKVIWRQWTAFAHVIARVQARAMLTLFYFVVFAPFALGLKLFSDPLGLGHNSPPAWIPRPPSPTDPMKRAKRAS